MFTVSNSPQSLQSAARDNALTEALKLSVEVENLRRGRPPYDQLTPAERAEQIAALAIGLDGPALFPGFKDLTDDQLIAIVAADPATLPIQRDKGETSTRAVMEAVAELERRLFPE